MSELEDLRRRLREAEKQLIDLDGAMLNEGKLLTPIMVGKRYYISTTRNNFIGTVQAIGKMGFVINDTTYPVDNIHHIMQYDTSNYRGSGIPGKSVTIYWNDMSASAEIEKIEFDDNGRMNVYSQDDSSCISIDLSTASAFTVTLDRDRYLSNPDYAYPGMEFSLEVIQDAAGGHNLTFSSSFQFLHDGEPSISASPGASSVLSFISVDGSTIILDRIE